MPPKKNSYVDQIRESFLREFNYAKKQYEAEKKQDPIKNCASELIEDFTICLS